MFDVFKSLLYQPASVSIESSRALELWGRKCSVEEQSNGVRVNVLFVRAKRWTCHVPSRDVPTADQRFRQVAAWRRLAVMYRF